MLEPCAEPTYIEAITHFAAIIAVQFLSQKRRDVRQFDRVNQDFHEVWIERLQVALPFEHQVGRILGLLNAPLIGEF